MARRLMTSSMTSRDYGVVLMTLQVSKCRIIRKLGPGSTIRVDHLSIHQHDRNRITTLPEKKHFARPHSYRNSPLFYDESSPFRK